MTGLNGRAATARLSRRNPTSATNAAVVVGYIFDAAPLGAADANSSRHNHRGPRTKGGPDGQVPD